MSYIISGFFRCECGKIHQISGVTVTSVCTCDRGLWTQMVRKT